MQLLPEHIATMSREQLATLCQEYADLREFAEWACRLLIRIRRPIREWEAQAIQAEFMELLAFAVLAGITSVPEPREEEGPPGEVWTNEADTFKGRRSIYHDEHQ